MAPVWRHPVEPKEVAAAVLGGASLEGEPIAGGVGGGRRGVVEDGAQIEEMLLGGEASVRETDAA